MPTPVIPEHMTEPLEMAPGPSVCLQMDGGLCLAIKSMAIVISLCLLGYGRSLAHAAQVAVFSSDSGCRLMLSFLLVLLLLVALLVMLVVFEVLWGEIILAHAPSQTLFVPIIVHLSCSLFCCLPLFLTLPFLASSCNLRFYSHFVGRLL